MEDCCQERDQENTLSWYKYIANQWGGGGDGGCVHCSTSGIRMTKHICLIMRSPQVMDSMYYCDFLSGNIVETWNC